MRARIILAATFLLGAADVQAVDTYDDCLELVATDAARAELEAGDWARFGGGAPARHCYALALIELGAPLTAANELVRIATEEPGIDDVGRAEVMVQAGEILIEEGEIESANLLVEQALRLVPNNAAALGLRGAIRLQEGAPRAAVRDLNQALAARSPTARLLRLRSTGHRRMGNAVAARDDALHATDLAPEDSEAWLERGRVEAKMDDRPAARLSFLRAIDLDRDGKIGNAARIALQRMEAGYED